MTQSKINYYYCCCCCCYYYIDQEFWGISQFHHSWKNVILYLEKCWTRESKSVSYCAALFANFARSKSNTNLWQEHRQTDAHKGTQHNTVLASIASRGKNFCWRGIVQTRSPTYSEWPPMLLTWPNTKNIHVFKKVKVAHTRLPNVGFRSWSRFLAVSLQETWVINPAVGCHYFPPGLQLPSQPLRGLLPISLFGEQRHDGCEQFA